MTGVPPLASIVIVTYGKRHLTEACLASLDAALGDALGSTVELVLVDNASPDDTAELLRAWSNRATVLLQPLNRNFAGGCNDGAAAARGDVVIFLNNDTVVRPGVIEQLAEAAREPGVGAVGIRLLFPDGLLQHGGVIVASDGPYSEDVAPAVHTLVHHDGELPAARATYELDVVTGACLAMPRAVFEELGGFDEGYVNGWEDVDLCFRTRVSGRSVVYRGDLAIEHHEGATRAGMDTRPNKRRFLSIWGGMLEADRALARQAWDVELAEGVDHRVAPGGPVTVVGEVTGFGPAADEARALIGALEAAGAQPAAADLVPTRLRPSLPAPVAAALQRLPRADAVRIDVPFGAAWARKVPADALLRAAGETAPDGRTAGVLAATAVPPAIVAPDAPGPGGDGLLVSLPAHDRAAALAVLADLAAHACGQRVRLVPTVGARGLAALVAERLPDAELLPVTSDERRWAALAATADVAVCLDVDDRFERRALLAAAAGATPVVATANGPAGRVLGALATTTLPDALSRPADRARLAAAVRGACDPATVGRALLAAVAAPARLDA
jgi:GT2 family glycosyltransferase